MKIADMYRQPGHLIRRAHQISVAIFMEETRSLDITPVQFCALIVIGENSGIDATRVSELIAFDRATIGNVLARLEGKGLIVRRGGVKDKRTKLLFLTPKGQTIIRKLDAAAFRIRERLLAPLTASDRTAFLKLLSWVGEDAVPSRQRPRKNWPEARASYKSVPGT
jgi:DNA-binding MarR family transcriptional regulator